MVLVSARFQLERESAVQFVEISFFLPCLCSCSHVDDAINFLWRRICINYNVQLVLTQVVLGWLGNSICHLHISHNALHLPPKILYKRCLQFLLEQLYYPGEMKNKGDAKFWGANKAHYGRHASSIYLFRHVTAFWIKCTVVWINYQLEFRNFWSLDKIPDPTRDYIVLK